MPRIDPDVVCPACAAALADWRTVRSSEPAFHDLRFALRRCPSCASAVTIGEAPAQLHDTGAYRPGLPRFHRAARPVLHAFDRQRLALLSTLVPVPARLLDVGAGRGRFVDGARAAGYDAFGIEPSLRAWDAVARNSRLQRASISEADLPASTLDAVTLWHVLEHLEDPGAALKRISTWLRPGGGLLVGVPNLASIQARLTAEHWYHLDVPRHRVHFTVRGLSVLLERHGFEIVAVKHVLLEHNPFGMWQSLVNLVSKNPSYLYNLLKRNAPLRSTDLILTALSMPLAPLAALAELLAGLARRGGTIAVLARAADQQGSGE